MSVDYNKRLERVLGFIEANLDEALSLEQLSQVACFSKYHFHRLFKARVGWTLAEYIRYLRLKRAAYQLVYERERSVTDIAFSAGFESSESFSKAFKKHVGQSPRAFRASPNWNQWQDVNQFQREPIVHQIEIRNFLTTDLAHYMHQGAPRLIHESVQNFIAWRRENRLPPHKSRTFNILYDDPETTKDEDYRMGICCSMTQPVVENAFGIKAFTIPSLKCAFLQHKGSWDGLGPVINELYYDWLPNSGYEPADFPLFVERLNLFPETPEHELRTDVYLPLNI